MTAALPPTAVPPAAPTARRGARTTTFRRRAGAVTVLVAPVAFTVAELTAPADGGDPAAELASYAAHHGKFLLSIGAGLLASVLFVPAFFALMNPVRRRGTVLTHLGGALALLGTALSGLAVTGLQFVLYEASAPGVDRPAVARFLDQATADHAVGSPLLLGHFLFALGLALLGAGLFRARTGARWAAAALGLAPVLEAVLGTTGIEETALVALLPDLLLVAGAAGLAWWLLTSSDSAWEGADASSALVAA